jgi:hypothetical protein
VHALVTYGGINKQGEWIYPNTKYALARYRKTCQLWKTTLIKNITEELSKGHIIYHEDVSVLLAKETKSRWVVHSTRPTANTKTIETYLAKYINRIGISDKRVQYNEHTSQVCLLYNDYANQKTGEAAPKAIHILPALVFMHQVLQHVLPKHFQKSRHYGLHNASTKLKQSLPKILQRNGKTIRTILEIITDLLKGEKPKCEACGHDHFDKSDLLPNKKWILNFIKLTPSNKSPPKYDTI